MLCFHLHFTHEENEAREFKQISQGHIANKLQNLGLSIRLSLNFMFLTFGSCFPPEKIYIKSEPM